MILPSGISTSDYSRLANSKGWGSGWPACGGMSGNIVQIRLTRSGTSIAGGVHRNIAELFLLIGNEIERRGYLFHPGWCWGAECRAISGSNTPSNHSWGLAVDINAPNNPYTSSGVHDIPDWAYALFRSYGFGCGADYSGKKDWMHVEALGTPSDMAIMTNLARKNLGGGQPSPPTGDDELSAAEVAQINAKIDQLRNLLIEPQFQTGGHDYRKEGIWQWDNNIKPALDKIQASIDEVNLRLLQPGKAWDNIQDIRGNWLPDIHAQVLAIESNLGVARAPNPGGNTIPDAGGSAAATYTVVSGDTLSGIAAKTGKSQADLQTWNNITDPNSISIGQVLRLGP